MSVVISGVADGSAAQKRHILPGEKLLTINGHEIEDVLDYRFYIVDCRLTLEIADLAGQVRRISLLKQEYEDPGLEFETYLMDRKRTCKNHCIFCFIDQLPRGMRKSLYFKDDDERLSFLMGNYVTLTNLTEHEVDRILQLHLSPINVSVHTTDPALRAFMMGNPDAGRALGTLRRLADGGATLNCQLVLCRGINDGPALRRSLDDLGAMAPSVNSVSVVPVGLTRYRRGLTELTPYDAESAREVLSAVDKFAGDFYKKHGTRLVFAADEFYLLAGVPLPGTSFYEDFSQLENGVGMLSLLTEGFEEALASVPDLPKGGQRSISIATGVSAEPCIQKLVRMAEKKIAHLSCMVYAINNDFFGKNVTVSGLLTGTDLVAQLRGKPLGGELLISASMLRREDCVFLDDMTLPQAQSALGVRIIPVENDGAALLRAIAGIRTEEEVSREAQGAGTYE